MELGSIWIKRVIRASRRPLGMDCVELLYWYMITARRTIYSSDHVA